MMIRIVVRDNNDRTYLGEYQSAFVPNIDTIISTPYSNYLVVAVQHNLNHGLSSLEQTVHDITVYVRKEVND